MCGRFGLITAPNDAARFMDLDQIDPFPPRYNIAPAQPILMVLNGHGGKRQSLLARWGLVPAWVKDPGEFTLLLNARAETAAQKPSFRNAMRHRRALVPASGFYEWHRPADRTKVKQAYWITPTSAQAKGGREPIFCFGALMETWIGENGSEIDTGCILTTPANDDLGKIHHRMPVVIKPPDFERWLDCVNYEPRDVVDLTEPVENGFFGAIAVSDKVNKVSNMDAEIIKPVGYSLGENQITRVTASQTKNKSKSKRKDNDDQFSLF